MEVEVQEASSQVTMVAVKELMLYLMVVVVVLKKTFQAVEAEQINDLKEE